MSAGASRFIDNRSGAASPTQQQSILPSRAHAQKFKLKQGAASSTSSKLANTAAVPAYTSNPSASRNAFQQNEFYQQTPAFEGGAFDESVASNFDDTITTDIAMAPKHVNQDRGYYNEEMDMQPADYSPSYPQPQYQSQSAPKHKLHHKPGHSPMLNQQAEKDVQRHLQSSSISGRFDQPILFGNLTVRSAEAHQNSRKRSREHIAQFDRDLEEEQSSQTSELNRFEEEVDAFSTEETITKRNVREEEDLQKTPSASPRKSRRGPEPATLQAGPRDAKPPASAQEPILPEYTDAALLKMSYSDLDKEPWEKPEDKKHFQLAKPLRDTALLKDKLEHYVFKEGQDAQVSFYEQLSPGEWEEGGDWFVDRFTDLMNEIKKKRAEKKKATKKFEEELSARARLVRGKSDNLDREFRDMRVGGEGILKGKRF